MVYKVPAGAPTNTLPTITLGTDNSGDADGDGLSNFAEEVIGTVANDRDTDRDGISDLAEIRAGTDPLGGRSLPSGVVGALATHGQAMAVLLEGSAVTSSYGCLA